ncbi:MAG: CBS domain-containing protein [Myxococcota bacterium]
MSATMRPGPESVVTGHENTDLDAFASCVAAQRLAAAEGRRAPTLLLGRRLQPSLHRFLGLHRARFPAFRADEVDLDAVSDLTVCDTRSRSRVRHVEPVLARRAAGEAVRLRVYDHHPPPPDPLEGDIDVHQPVGAVTSLLVLRLLAAGVAIDTAEASLYALAIHADTGSLRHVTTQAEDAEALAALLGLGARTELVGRILDAPPTDVQRALLRTLLDEARPVAVDALAGRPAMIGIAPRPKKAEGLARVVEEWAGLTAAPVAIGIFARARGTTSDLTLVARSRSAAVDVGALLRGFGGGGHAGAAAARQKGLSAEDARARLEHALGALPPTGLRVASMMTRDVRSLSKELTLAEAATRLERWGVSGAPVTGTKHDERLVGVISTRDVARAEREGRLALPIASCMTHDPITVAPELPLVAAIDRMAERNVGRLPVVDGAGVLVGILSRSDALRFLYGEVRG